MIVVSDSSMLRERERRALKLLNEDWDVYASTPEDLKHFVGKVQEIRISAHQARKETAK